VAHKRLETLKDLQDQTARLQEDIAAGLAKATAELKKAADSM
jgi:hypothetical protein